MARMFRPGQWWLRLLISIVLLTGMIWLSKISYGQEVEFKITPNPVHPGDLVMFEIAGTPPAGPVVGWLGNQSFGFFWYKNRLIGFSMIPLDQKANSIGAIVGTNSKKSEGLKILLNKDLRVDFINWPERRVGETPPLSSKKLARYLKEKALIKRALETTAEEPLWRERFVAPIWGNCAVIRFIPTCSPMEETSPFGQKRIGPTKIRQHRGVDLRTAVGRPVYSMNGGRVVLTGNFLADGKIVIIDHGLGLHTLYLHLSRIKVKKGQMVKRGQVLGLSGNTGFSEGPHLHLEVRLNGEAVNPLQILEILK